MQTQDLMQVRTQLDLDRTTTANLLFAQVSKFYAIRSEIRKVFLQSLMPDLPQMYNLMKPREGWDLTDQQVIDICAERLAMYRKIAEAYGSNLGPARAADTPAFGGTPRRAANCRQTCRRGNGNSHGIRRRPHWGVYR